MSAEKATALVLRTTDWSESSRIATLWTREFGKVRVLAKGGRRLKSNFENALDLLTLCRIVFLRKSSDSLDLLTEAQVIQRFPRLRTDLAALYAAYYVAELLAEGTRDYDPHPLLFDEALDALQTLGGAPPHPSPPPQGGREQHSPSPLVGEGSLSPSPLVGEGSLSPSPLVGEGSLSPSPLVGEGSLSPSPLVGEGSLSPSPLVGEGSLSPSPLVGEGGGGGCGPRVARFEMVLLRELGYSPVLDHCAGCGGSVVETELAFSAAANGVLCRRCRGGQRDSRPLSPSTWRTLQELAAPGDDRRDAGPTVWRRPWSAQVRTEVRQLLGQYVTYLLGRRPRLLSYLGS